MKRISKMILVLVGVISITFGSVSVIFAKNLGTGIENVNTTVNPDMALLAAGIVMAIGIIIFMKRNVIKEG